MYNMDNLITALKDSQQELTADELVPLLQNLNKVLSNKGKKLLIQDEKPKKQYPLTFQRFMGVQMGFQRIMHDKDLTGVDRRVLDFFLAYMDQKNIIRHSQQDMANELKIKREAVTRSIKKLKEKDIVQYKGSKRNGFYIVNPEIAWKGRTDDWYDLVEIAKLMKQNSTFIKNKYKDEEYDTSAHLESQTPF